MGKQFKIASLDLLFDNVIRNEMKQSPLACVN